MNAKKPTIEKNQRLKRMQRMQEMTNNQIMRMK